MKSKILLFLTLLLITHTNSQNLITNGDFQSGLVGFATSATGYTALTAPFSGTTVTGNYALVQNAKAINTANFIFEGDHTNGTLGYMLAFDGTTATGNPRFWQAGNAGAGVTGLTIGTTYRFSYWIKSISNLGSPADIGIQLIGGTLPVITSGNPVAPAPAQSWRQVIYTFVATASTVQIELWNNNTTATGNDFAVDDFMLTDDLIVSANVTNAACATAADGSITVTGFGGTPPYLNYTIAGPVNQNNATGIFPNLPPGIYTVTVTDSALPTAATATLANVVVGPHITVTNNATVLCGGTPVNLNAAGSPSGYTWTASPADPSLTTPNIANPTVSPAVTTTYTVTSTVGSCAPITNTVTITVTNPRPTATITNSPSCVGSPFTVTANPLPSGTYSYVWTVPAPETNPGNVASFVSNTAGAYSVVVTNTATTCSSATVVRNIAINALPNVTSPSASVTICPGNTATFTITGTPFSTVYFSNPTVIPLTGPINIPASGTTTFTTPVLSESVVYTLTEIRGFLTGCGRLLTGLTLTVNVVPNGCATVGTVPAPGTQPLDVTLCTTGECRTLQANAPPVPSTTSYTVASIPYCPQAPFDNPSWIQLYPLPPTDPRSLTDDDWADVFSFPAGMNFCFFGNNYTSLQVGTNGIITFKFHPPDPPNNDFPTCRWDYTLPIPNTSYSDATGGTQAGLARDVSNSIMGVYQDTNFGVADQAPNAKNINYQVVGNYPCRKFIVNYKDLPQFSCGNSVGVSTMQIVLYEVSNIIEVYVQRRTACNSWNSGNGTIGIMNAAGTQGYAAPGRNAVPFSTDPTPANPNNADNVPEAWRFTPTGPPVSQTINWYQGPASPANLIGTGPTIQVCPAATTTYTLETVFNVCGIPQTATTTQTLFVTPDLTGSPVDITECTNIFDLTVNTPIILGSLNPLDYEITYHTSQVDANSGNNPITNPAAYSPGTTGTFTVYACIYINSSNCRVVKPFDLIIDDCSIHIGDTQDLTLCDDITNDGSATFDLTPQIAVALDGQSAADFTVTFHATPTGPAISPINAYVGNDGDVITTIITDNADPTSTRSDTFILHVNTFANAGTDGSINVCETSITPINLFSVITGEQTGGIWTQTSGTGGTFNAAAGTFTPAVGATTSTFTYTVDGTTPCVDDTSLATVNIIAQPTAGADGGIVVCATSATPIDLFSLITGEQLGGTWVRSSGTGGVFSAAAGTFAPTAGATTSTFTYTLTGTFPCINDSSIATVTIAGQPDAGTDGSIVVCETSITAINLNTLITGEQPGGVWTQTTGTGGVFNAAAGTYTPAVGATNSTFTYTLSGVAPCITDTSLASVNIIAQPTAGADGGTVVCETSTVAVDLFSLITGEQLGGTWVRSTGTGGVFNAAAGTYTPAVGATLSTFTYTVTGTAPCINDDSIATITINAQPNAGADGGTMVCETSLTVINLFNLITGEQAGGVWTQTSGTGGTFNAAAGTYTPAVGATTSTFTYTLTGTAPCINDTSLATVTINAQPNAGVDGSTIVCETSTAAVNLFNLITGEQSGGVWTQNTGTGGTFNAAAGTYIPAVSATNPTFTYTLTGTAPCINDASLASITINRQPIAGTDGGTTICENDTAVINLFSLIAGEQSGGTWTRTTGSGGTFNTAAGTFTPALGVTNSTFTYTLTGTAPCINDDSVATITINPLPTATISGTASVCMGGTAPFVTFRGFNGTPPYTFTYTVSGTPGLQTGVSSGPNNTLLVAAPSTVAATTFTFTLISVLDDSATACSQNQNGTATITVIAAPIINTPTDYIVCDDLDNNGYYCGFDLTTKDVEISTDPNVTITYHETPTDASTGGNPIPAIPLYCNIDPGSQTIYVRVFNPSAPLCYSTTTFDLIINPVPLPNPVITDYALCDYTNPGDGVEVFDLGTKSVEIANGQLNVTVTYYASLTDARNQSNPLTNLYSNTSNPQQVWINIRDNATGCNTTGSFNLIVNPLPVANMPPAIFECSNGTTLTAQFDLRVNEGFVKGGIPGLSISYFHTLPDAQLPTGAILNPASYTGSDGEVIIIRLEDDATGCYSTTTQLLRVTQGPLAVTPTPLEYCDPNNDGFGVFDLDSKILEIEGGTLDPNVTVTFHETPDDAYIGANSLTSPYDNIDPWLQTIYVRVFYTLTGCANYVELQLIVNPTPEATEPADYELCDYSGAAGIEPFDLTTRIPEILGAINPALTTVTFYTTLTDAQTPTGAIVGITNYLSGNTTLYVRVETTATGCFDIVALNLVVNPLPNSLQPNYPQYSLCDTDQANIGYETFDLGSKIDDILLGQLGMDVTFWPSLGDAQNGTGQITNLMYTNTIQYVQTIGITITNHATGCFVISTMDLRVEPLPTPIPPIQPYTICDGNQDGFSCGFDLSTLMPDILQGANYTLTFYETPTDAATGNPVTAINPNTPYCNIDPFMQLLYVRAEDNITHCFSVMPIQLNVDPSPMAPIQLDDIVICDDDNNPQSATRLVDLTQRTADVLAQQPLPVGSYTVTYYKLQSDAQGPSNPIIPASSYFGSDGEEIWVRVENNASQCFNIGSFHLVINTPLLLTTPTPLSMCDDDAAPNDQYHVFDLTVKNLQIAPGGQMVTYYPSLALAQGGVAGTEIATPTAYQNMNPQHPAVQTLGVVVTTADGCKSITTLDIRVLPIPTPRTNPPALAPKCDDNNPGDMLEVFDLTQNEAYIRNGDPNLTFHYYLTLADAQGPLNEIANPSAASVGGNVWIRVENNRVDYQGNHCYVLVEQALTVNPLPQVIQPLAPYRVCDNDADGLAQFDLTNPALAPLILGTATTNQQPADYTITYHATPGNAATGAAPLVSPYTNIIPTSDTVYIRVVNNATGCVNASGVLPLAVEPYATATGPQSFADCDNYGDPYDGVHQIDLTQFEAAILNGQNPAVFLVSYYRTQADADAGTSPLTAAEEVAYTTDPDTDTIWVKVENSSNTITPYCYALTTINITVERYPDPIINTPNGVHTICVDFLTGAVLRPLTLDSGIANTAGYTFEWFEAGAPTAVIGTDATYEVNTADAAGATRSYTVHVTSISALACDTTSAPFDVIQSGPAVIPAGTIGYTVSNAFSNTQIITVSVEGYGTYEYSLDDGPRQAGNVFEDVSFGTHTIHVWDTEGGIAYSCEQLIIEEVQIIDYPHYFTPNGDGVHDTWNIVGLGGQPGAKIYIFDRYGKLLKQISSTGEGWNGTYNGHLLPSDDYWFTVDFMEDAVIRQFKAHFTLKR